MWHASIAHWKHNSMLPTGRWGEGVFRAARRLAANALRGVGSGELVELVSARALHVRRALSAQEYAGLSAEWLAIPARDEFGDGGMEMRL